MLRKEYKEFFINGAWRPSASAEVFEVTSPLNGEVIGSVPNATDADVDAAVEAARSAFYETDWPHRSPEDRASLCEALANEIQEHMPEFVDLIVEELGCTRMMAEVYQAAAPAMHWNYNAAAARNYDFEEIRTADLSPYVGGSAGGGITKYETKSLVVKEPVGVVATFLAYNFAFPASAQKVAPAIVAGCTVVIKAPEQDPLAVFALGDLIEAVGFPPGVINIIAAGPTGSERLVGHPDVDMVSFTGSSAIGSKVGEQCGSLIRPAVLELGGKSAAIVLEDADLETVIKTLPMVSVIPLSGQSCVCMSRVLVPTERYDEVAERLSEAFSTLKTGDPDDPETVVGPVVTVAHRDRVLGYVQRAVAAGADVLAGGRIPPNLPDGAFIEPTLLTQVTRDSEIAQEEVFGPVVVLIAFDDEDDAVRLANESKYGLAGCVFTSDVEHGFEVARKIRTGTFGVNTYAADFNSPFGGVKQSGFGREHGLAGLEGYLVPKTISVDPTTEIPVGRLEIRRSRGRRRLIGRDGKRDGHASGREENDRRSESWGAMVLGSKAAGLTAALAERKSGASVGLFEKGWLEPVHRSPPSESPGLIVTSVLSVRRHHAKRRVGMVGVVVLAPVSGENLGLGQRGRTPPGSAARRAGGSERTLRRRFARVNPARCKGVPVLSRRHHSSSAAAARSSASSVLRPGLSPRSILSCFSQV